MMTDKNGNFIQFDDGSVETSLSTKESKKLFKEAVDRKIAKCLGEFFETLEKTIRDNLRRALPGVLGFSKSSWNSYWEIDHCNGRESTISALISAEAKRVVADKINEILTTDLVGEIMNDSKFQNAIRKDFIGRFTAAYTSAMSTKAEELGEKMAEEQMRGALAEITNLDMKHFDPADPDMSHIAATLMKVVENLPNPEMGLKLLKVDGIMDDDKK